MGKRVKIGLIREGKTPIDRRVVLSPEQAKSLQEQLPQLEVIAQPSLVRCYKDEEYSNLGIQVSENMDQCDVLMGVKEVPIDELIAGKTYFFFSHTIKMQAYNRGLLKAILEKNIRLLDYECLVNENKKRVVAFGRYAGIVGAYNGILTYGRKHKLFELRRAKDCFDLSDMKTEYAKVELPPIKIVITGGGRVAKGAMEVLNGMGIKQVSINEYLHDQFDYPVFVQLNSKDYHLKRDGSPFVLKEFYDDPSGYASDFKKFTKVSDILIASAYWDPKAPVLFTREDMLEQQFKINVIADITCDIEGSIPSTKQPSTIEDPIYDYDPAKDVVTHPLSSEYISVMAVDNLPCELPRDASVDFGKELMNHVFPKIENIDKERILKDATITKDGQLTQTFSYLQSYVDQDE